MPLNELQQIIYDKVVKPELEKIAQNVRAVIVAYDNEHNTASIEFPSVYGNGTTHLDDVPVNIGSGGLHTAGPFVGDEVWVGFVNGDPLLPQITSMVDLRYSWRTREKRLKHTNEGAYLPDGICNRI